MVLDEQKVDDIFSNFLRSGGGSDDIKQIYDTLPYLNSNQQRVLTLYQALAIKYKDPVLQSIHDSVLYQAKTNRKTGFRFTRLIESYSLYKHFKGYNASANMSDTDKK